ncbi:MAG: permease [Candidatus Bathyarchaeota archaeon]|nr:permease [Candidatus Bathyarchaeota archaeon]MDH5733048.1 permease [Candidatus Bathyarchaeota archaeon]
MESLLIKANSIYGICHGRRSRSGGVTLIIDIVYLTLERFLRFLPLLVVAIVLAKALSLYISEDKIGLLLKAERRNLLVSSLLGLVTPGPLAPYLPLLKVLQSSGLPLSVVAAFITSQTLVGPLRAFLEVDLFGLAFFAFRVATSFTIAIGIGVCFQLLNKRLKQKTTCVRA